MGHFLLIAFLLVVAVCRTFGFFGTRLSAFLGEKNIIDRVITYFDKKIDSYANGNETILELVVVAVSLTLLSLWIITRLSSIFLEVLLSGYSLLTGLGSTSFAIITVISASCYNLNVIDRKIIVPDEIHKKSCGCEICKTNTQTELLLLATNTPSILYLWYFIYLIW